MTAFQKIRIAFIGLGAMGMPMAHRLLSAGYDVVGADLSAAARDRFTGLGGRSVALAKDAFNGADVAITMLPNGAIVQDAIFKDEAWRVLKPGALMIDMSSSAPGDTQKLSERLAGTGLRLVDAPVSGGVKRAISGSLAIMVGGEEADIKAAQPILSAMGERIFPTGAIGSGHAMKSINNFVSGAGVLAAVEALLLGKRFGLDPDTIVDILNASSGKNNATDVKMKQFIMSETFGSGFGLGLMAKDIRIAANLSQALGLQLAMLMHTADAWDAAQSALGGAVDHTRIIDFLKTKE